ncbi:ribbon-helix-helix protein, CopG family (plasmid) [Natrinema pallidum]|uniref:Ribbon-helix-helix protein, CopG family n=1 Tax=Natrinema pallidum TaxID=69527 RepID=A0A4P9TJQ9_9EURY|nr:ribbon-helix-helix protein, CopG family [Natrinema pallidum]
MVDAGVFPNRSEAIRAAIRQFVTRAKLVQFVLRLQLPEQQLNFPPTAVDFR